MRTPSTCTTRHPLTVAHEIIGFYSFNLLATRVSGLLLGMLQTTLHLCVYFFGGEALLLVGNSRFSEGSTIHMPHQRCSPISEANTLSERAIEIFVHSGATFFSRKRCQSYSSSSVSIPYMSSNYKIIMIKSGILL